MIRSLPGLTEFLRAFHRHWRPDPRMDPAVIPADLPAGLRHVYRELGALIDIPRLGSRNYCGPFSAGDNLFPLGKLQRENGMVRFADENQHLWTAYAPLNAEDPPVYLDVDESWTWIEDGYREICGSLNHFLITLCLREAVISCRWLTCVLNLRGHSRAEAVALPVTPLWTGGWYVYGRPTHDFYHVPGEDLLVMDDAEGELFIGSHENCLDRVLRPEIDYMGIHWE